MRVLVLGGTGFIGAPAVRALHELGHTVTVLHRGETIAELPDGISRLTGDRTRLGELRGELGDIAADVVLDVLASTEADALELVRTFAGTAARVVVLSSQDVYRAHAKLLEQESGPPDPIPLAEESPLRSVPDPRDEAPRGNGGAKVLVERVVCGEPRLRATILRLPAVYGPGDRQHRLFDVLKRVDDGRPAIVLPKSAAGWRRTRAYVEDVAVAIARACSADHAAECTYNLGERSPLSLAAWVEKVARIAGFRGDVVSAPDDLLPPQLRLPIDPEHELVADTTRIRRELAYRDPLTREEGLRRTIAWERANPPERIDPKRFDYAAEDAVLAALRSAR